MRLRPALDADRQSLAATHQLCFPGAAWPAEELGDLLASPGGYGVVAQAGPDAIDGFIICRTLAGEAEVLTLAVAPDQRRAGLARALIEAAASLARCGGAGALFLEVAADNDPAIALYQASGFERVGLRRGYYRRGRTAPIDALVYRRPLNRGPG